jgi:hypothetical protein
MRGMVMDDKTFAGIEEALGPERVEVVQDWDITKIDRFYEMVNMWIDETQAEGYFDDWLEENGFDPVDFSFQND